MVSNFLGSFRRPRIPEDEGLAALADMEAGFSGKAPLFSTSSNRRQSYRAFLPSTASLSPKSVLPNRALCQETHHFLQSCFLCNKPLPKNKDIFMYRGDTPFCSEQCREEQIEMDEAKEKNWSGLSMKLSSRKDNRKASTKNQNFHAMTGTVAAG